MLGKQPNTIDGYRSLIVDNLEIHPLTSVRMKISLVSWIVSSETDPEAGVAYPPGTSHWPCTSWDSFWSNQGGPLEAFDLQDGIPLGPWVGQVQKWDSCLAKLIFWTPIRLVKGVPVSITQLSILESAGHRVSSVAPGVITALASTLDRSLKSDRSLCPVRALCYYLDRTSDIRQNKEVVFVSFKKGFNKDISPATISSWIKRTVILCYELSDQEAHI